jgi:hypothetical protein
MISEKTQKIILEHFEGLDIWRECWEESAVAIVGSSLQALKDEFTDIDVLAFVPQAAYRALYEDYRNAVKAGRIEVLNPNAFQYDEFPLVVLPKTKGHYQVHTFEEVENIVGQYDDIIMWIHRNSLVLHDPSGRYGNLQKEAQAYPDQVWKKKVRFHYLEAYRAATSASNPLRRGDKKAVFLTMTDCLVHLLRLCCLLERRPFPYDKWLYREAIETAAGRELKPLLDNFFEELRRPELRRIEPTSYERPGHRNADLEAYPLHNFWRRAKRYFEQRLPQ